LMNFVDATNDANHYTKPPPTYWPLWRYQRKTTRYKSVVNW